MENENPWKIIGEEIKYDNPWISLTEYQVINPSGNKGIYGKVHFKNKAIGIIPMDAHGNIWLVGQYRFPLNSYSWEIPEGGGPFALDPLQSAQRELLEETGLVAQEWTLLLKSHLSNSVTDEEVFVFVAKELKQETPQPEETEQLQIKKLPFAAVYEMVMKGEITDAITIMAILKLKLLMDESI